MAFLGLNIDDTLKSNLLQIAKDDERDLSSLVRIVLTSFEKKYQEVKNIPVPLATEIAKSTNISTKVINVKQQSENQPSQKINLKDLLNQI